MTTPWDMYRSKLAALFELDEEVDVGEIEGDGAEKAVALHVRSFTKAKALEKILVKTIPLGNITLSVNVVYTPPNEETPDQILKAAFAYSRRVRRVESFTDIAKAQHTYVIFEPDVVQFYADDLSDYQGNFNGLAEDVARELFAVDPSVNFCTADVEEN